MRRSAKMQIAATLAVAALSLSVVGQAQTALAADQSHPTRSAYANLTEEQKVIVQVTQERDPHAAVEISRTSDERGFARKVALLRSATSFYGFLDTVYADPEFEVQKLAAISTVRQAETINRNSKGMRYVVTGSGKSVRVERVPADRAPSGSIRPALGLDCWEAYAGFLLWNAGSGMICGALTIAGVVPGVICGGIKLTADMILDWNEACN